MTGGLRVVVDGSRVVELEAHPPVAAKVLPGDGAAEVMIIGAAAGLLEGDEISIDLTMRPGAHLMVRTTAATLAHPCPGGGWTATVLRACLGAGATLAWLPEPLVACGGCRHRARAIVELEPGAAALWLETLALGRTGEHAGVLDARLDVMAGGAPLLREGLRHPQGAASPAVLGGAGHVGSLHLLGRRPARQIPGTLVLAGPGATYRALASDAADLERRLAPVRSAWLAELPVPTLSVPNPAPEEDLIHA